MPVTVRLVDVAFVPNMLANPSQPVEVTFVKMAAAAVVRPMDVPLMVPPVIVTDGETRLAAFTVMAFNVVPEAVTKPSQPVEVALTQLALVARSLVAKKLVVVTLVAVALPKMNPSLNVTAPFTTS